MDTNKGKVIKTIVLAAIILGCIFMAMAPTASAQENLPLPSYSGLNNTITLSWGTPAAVSVIIGQELVLAGTNNSLATISGDPTSATIAGEIFTADATGKFATSAMTKTGIYYVNPVGGSSTESPTAYDAKLAVTSPTMTLDLKSGGTSVSSITENTTLQISFSNNLNGSDMVSLVVTDPDGNTLTSKNAQNFSYINVSYLTGQYGAPNGINTAGWKIGDYKFKVQTKKIIAKNVGARGLEASSNEKTLSIIKSTINIEADKTSVIELATVKLTVTGKAGNTIQIWTSDPAHTIFPGGSNDNPATDSYSGFTKTIDADGMRIFTVKFNATGSYTITVTDLTAAGQPTDTVDIKVSRKAVIFDVPRTVVIGEKFTINGTSNTGSFVTIAVDDYVYPELDRLVLDTNKEFSKEIDTATAGIAPFTDSGPVQLTAFIDRPMTYIGDPNTADETDDGSATIFMLNDAGGAIDISASEIYVGKNESIILTIGAVPDHNVSVTTGDPAHTVFEYNRYDFTGTSNNIITRAPADTISIPADIGDCGSQAAAMNIPGVWKTVNADGKRKFEENFD